MTRLLGLMKRRQYPVRARGVRAAYGNGVASDEWAAHGELVVVGECRAYKDLSLFPVCGGSIRPLSSQRARREPPWGPKT